MTLCCVRRIDAASDRLLIASCGQLPAPLWNCQVRGELQSVFADVRLSLTLRCLQPYVYRCFTNGTGCTAHNIRCLRVRVLTL